MKMKMPFDGFYLKLLDEQNGTHEYEEYLRNCKENPLTEEEQREWTESARAAIAELEQLNAEPEPTRQAAEPEVEAEGTSSPQTPEPAELQEGCCAVQEAEEVLEVEVVPAEAIVPLGQTGEDAPAEKERWAYASELIGDAFQHWGNGRVLLDMGTGRGKNEFIIKKLVSWRVDEMLKKTTIGRVLCLCPLNTLHAEMLQRRTEAAIAEVDGEPMEIAMTNDAFYENMLEVRTYQNIETKYRNDPASLKKYLTGFKYIVADECHYFTDFSSYGINTYLSLEVLQKAEADHVVIYMSATGEETYKLLEETSKTPEDRIYKLPQDYQHIKQKYFYSRENLVMMLKCLPEDEKAVIFVSSGGDLLKMKEIFGDTAAYYCSENNPKYGKMFNKLTECVKDRELQKRYLFTTKAFGIGTEIKDRTVKHLYIDQWKPTDIIQSTGRKRSLDVDDTENRKLAEENKKLEKEKEKLASINVLQEKKLGTINDINNIKERVIEKHLEFYQTQYDFCNCHCKEIGDVRIEPKVVFQYSDFIRQVSSYFDGRSAKNSEVLNYQYKKEGYEEFVKNLLDKMLTDKYIFKGNVSRDKAIEDILSSNPFEIEYDISYQGDELRQMSEGKTAFVILKMLLDFSKNEYPILIDQPEDDLDNRAIFEELVKYLRAKKLNRQIILVTHNPNVVVGADAEEIIVANQEGIGNSNPENIKFAYKCGALENSFKTGNSEILLSCGIREHVCELLEGGNKAFRLREKKYQLI